MSAKAPLAPPVVTATAACDHLLDARFNVLAVRESALGSRAALDEACAKAIDGIDGAMRELRKDGGK